MVLLGAGVRVVWQRNVVPSLDVTIRAASAFCLPPNEALRLQPGPGSTVDAEFIDYVTDYAGAGSGPLVCHVRGNAPDLNEAMRVLGNIGGTNLPALSFAANAAMLPPSSIVAYEARDGGSYLAIGSVDPQPIQTARRTISAALTSAFVSAVDSHPDTHRLRLAITNYTESLTRLHPDVGVAAGLHLYIAVENLTDVIAHRIQRDRDLAGRSELAAELGLRPRAGEAFVRDGEIRGCLRREYIFDSNAEAYRKMKRLSDGVEHGFIDFAEARELAEEWFCLRPLKCVGQFFVNRGSMPRAPPNSSPACTSDRLRCGRSGPWRRESFALRAGRSTIRSTFMLQPASRARRSVRRNT